MVPECLPFFKFCYWTLLDPSNQYIFELTGTPERTKRPFGEKFYISHKTLQLGVWTPLSPHND